MRTAGAVGLVLVVGITAFLLARTHSDHSDSDGAPPASGADPDHTFSVDGQTHACLSANTVRLTADVYGTTSATFVVDGAEVASEPAVTTVSALMPEPVTRIPCDDGRTHRVEVVTDRAGGCQLRVEPNATFTEAKNTTKASNTAELPRGVCTLSLRD